MSYDLNLALAAHQRGEFDIAEPHYRAAIAEDGDNIKLLNFLATLLAQQSRYQEAKPFFERAIAIDDQNISLLSNYGHLLYRIQDYPRAKQILMKSYELQPNNPGSYVNLSMVLCHLGEFDAATRIYDRFIDAIKRAGQLVPFTIYRQRAEISIKAERYDHAIDDLKAGLEQDGAESELLPILADAMEKKGETEKAEYLFQGLLADDPFNPKLLSQYGALLSARGDHDHASTYFERAVRSDPNSIDLLCNLALCHYNARNDDSAITAFQNILNKDPNHSVAMGFLANVFRFKGAYDEGLKTINQALKIDSANPDLWRNKALIHKNMAQYEEALKACKKAVECDPQNEENHISLALLYLLMGDFEKGWPEYQWRWKKKGQQVSEFQDLKVKYPDKSWNSNIKLTDKHLILAPEQGYGDFIQFYRYVLLMAKHAKQITVPLSMAHERLIPMITPTLPDNVSIALHGTTINDFDYHTTMLDVAGMLWKNQPYQPPLPTAFHPDHLASQAALDLIKRFPMQNGGKKIGLVAGGNPEHPNDRRRSIPLADFEHIFELPHNFYLLQKDLRDSDSEIIKQTHNLHPIGPNFENFAQTAAVIDAMDMVISVDTSVAHLAATQNVETWLLLPFNPDWRWLISGQKSQWYPAMRLFRQEQNQGWQAVLHKIYTLLAKV